MSDYSESLKDPRWQKKRLEVFERDEWKCVGCRDESNTLCVHHKRYSGEPWEVELDDLQTLCETCHNLLPEHPRGGVWWSGEYIGNEYVVGFSWDHCPCCGSKNLRDKGPSDKCNDCGCSITPIGFPEIVEELLF